ncbi:type 1 glutamine amidotransferase [Paenibacillus flagellatus]|uniref:Amidotransferase n=1 Tax=Paenibacillus flagellatus TaxID=2211139 RepID=A0A2V5K804_9BACL|nr:type 1 glutamine amidotransferase [Paenibacillus flagellatus]PYI55609.1 amidotransferase [Paenibacillus flagellatus]
MRIHYLQHVPFEAPDLIAVWAKEKGHRLSGTALYESSRLPDPSAFDMLVVLGGPMGVHDEADYPWLVPEKRLIRETVQLGKPVLGICLGAQLLAEAAGGSVTRNPVKEIGWFPVRLTEEAKRSETFGQLPEQFLPFHWHGDTFSLPDGATRIAFSLGCANQAFEYGDGAIGLQFHLECSESGIRRMIEHGRFELGGGEFVQRAEDMTDRSEWLSASKAVLWKLLDGWEAGCRSRMRTRESERANRDRAGGEPYRVVGD